MTDNTQPEAHIGLTTSPSSTQDIKIVIRKKSGLDQLKNQMVYLDVKTKDDPNDEGFTSVNRAIGFINEITTFNPTAADASVQSLSSLLPESQMAEGKSAGEDLRLVDIKVASVFTQNEEGWRGDKPLPTSPATNTRVYRAGREVISSLFDHFDDTKLSYLGHIRGTNNVPAPLIMPYFGGSRGASSTAIVGRTGSGKTVFTSQIFANMMKYEDHAIIAVDPQGQWNNENGLTFSLKKFAEGLGRKVYSLRVSEDIQLELNEDNFVEIMTQLDLWTKVGRMGKENRDLLSVEVAESIVSMNRGRLNSEKDFRKLLSEVLRGIIDNPSTVARIYASEDRQKNFRQSIYGLVDPAEGLIYAYANANERKLEKELESEMSEVDEKTIRERAIRKCLDNGTIAKNPEYKGEDGDETEYIVSQTERESVDSRWSGILAKFTPLINLFQSTNLKGERRRPLAGPHGFLEEILKVRDPEIDEPAPYVILDMSPDTKAKAKSDFVKGSNDDLNMRRLLDNESIKGTILSMVFSSLKEASEEAFANGGGNLNTQIAFDEAWRYAPEKSENEVIMKLSKTLEGFALDTRKFGIGWTYILQSPTDLRSGIWKQLKFVYSGYGLVGADLGKLGDLMDDAQTQLKTYKQFVAPDLTGEYPFMITGSVSPLITAQLPLFVNAYNEVEEFLEDNRNWINAITKRRSKPFMTAKNIAIGTPSAPSVSKGEVTSYSIGKQTNEENSVKSSFVPSGSSRKVSDEGPVKNDSIAPPF